MDKTIQFIIAFLLGISASFSQDSIRVFEYEGEEYVEMHIETFGSIITCYDELDTLYATVGVLDSLWNNHKHLTKKQQEAFDKATVEYKYSIKKSQESYESCTQQVVNIGLKNRNLAIKLDQVRKRNKFWAIAGAAAGILTTAFIMK